MCVVNKGNIHEISRSIRCKNRGKKNVLKKTIIQNNIYVVQQFAYVYKVVVILLFIGKNIRCGSIVFGLFLAHCGSSVHDRNTIILD